MRQESNTMLDVGQPFPDFTLRDQDDKPITLDDLKGTPCVVYFYPKDDTSGCTVEACEFRDTLPDFGDAKVFGVSPDNPKSHRKFVDKYGLNFTLISDPERALCEACGVWVEKSMYGKKYMGVARTTFALDSKGIVRAVWEKVTPKGHAAEVLASLK